MEFEEELKNLKTCEPLSRYTTVGIGGPAEYLFIPEGSNDFKKTVLTARKFGVQITVLGKGSNVLVSDFGVRGLVIVNIKGKYETVDDTKNVTNIVCDSGVSLQKLAVEMFEKNLVGLENFAGIPCSIGGAVYNNIHGGEHLFSELVEWVKYLDVNNHIRKVLRDNCEFGYDESIFQKNHGIILKVCLKLNKGDGKLARQKWDEIRKKKLEVQPQRSLGCVFKNLSEEDVKKNNFPTPSTGWFIQEKLKMTGYRIGSAAISLKHHNFIENVGNASAKDYLQVIKDIQKKAKNEFGITLELEIQLLGF